MAMCTFANVAQADVEAAWNAFDRVDHETALREFHPLAEKGDVHAQFMIALLENATTFSTGKNDGEHWLEKAVENGHPRALWTMGQRFNMLGRKDPKNYEEALRWFHRSADTGYPLAMANIAVMYEMGYGVALDIPEAVKWHKRAAEHGNTRSLWEIDRINAKTPVDRALAEFHLYQYGIGVRVLTLAADAGDARAQIALADLYEIGDAGWSIAADSSLSLKLVQMAAAQGNALGLCELGERYISGSQGLDEDIAQALKYFRLAAKQGLPRAVLDLSRMYGWRQGVERNIPLAIAMLTDLSQNGNADASEMLADWFASGTAVPKDDAQAAKWYLKSANLGSLRAQSLIASYFANGKGVAKNLAEARKWFVKAFMNDSFKAARALEEMWVADGADTHKKQF